MIKMDKKVQTIGYGIAVPPKAEGEEDTNCPFHGSLKVHGRSIVGRVISDKMRRTITIQWERRIYIPKYERYMVKTSKIKAHNPDCIAAKEGDMVKIMQCKPISKLKSMVVVEKVSEEEAAAKK